MTKDKYDAMTDAEKAAYKEKMSMMKSDFTDRIDGQSKNNMNMKTMAGYNKMSAAEKAVFDKKMQGFQQGRKDDESAMKKKLEAMKTKLGFSTMTDDKKKAFLKEFMDDNKSSMGMNEKGRM